MAKGRRAASRLARSFSSALAAAGCLESIPRPRLDWRGLCLILVFHMIGFTLPRAPAATLVVDPHSGPYYTIQSAILTAAADDTIEVHPGLYPEQLRPLVPMTILGRGGADSTFVSGGGIQRVLEFESVAVVVDGLTFEDGRVEGSGGAVLCTNGTFNATRCVFRGNRAFNESYDLAFGGAIAFVGESWTSLVDCLFIHNEADNPRASYGGAIGVDGVWGQSRPPSGSAVDKDPPTRYLFQSCSFISNRARATAGIWTNKLVEIRNCVFVDKGSSIGAFVYATVPPALNCNIYLDQPSPQYGDRAMRPDEEPQTDPRICPGAETSVHSSSPLWSDLGGCGRIGNLPVGCTGPMVLATTPLEVQPDVGQRIHLYGYGLEEVLDARLEGPHGERVPSNSLTFDGPWLQLEFDLEGQSRGIWALILRTATGGEIHAADIRNLAPLQLWGFFDGWVPAPSVYEGRIAGIGLLDDLRFWLEHSGDGTPVVPIEVLESMGRDSLRVRVDLTGAPEGAYDLVVELWEGETRAVRPALYLGSPPLIRVPEDVPTIGEALAAAAPCSEIRVAAGAYEDSLVIDRPVRLRGVASFPTSWLKPAGPGRRVIHVLPEAGPLTEIEGFSISGGQIEGPGAGIYCEAPALIRNNRIGSNAATGAGARGAGIFAAPGARIIGNNVTYNRISSSTVNPDVWSTDPGTGGVGGGLFCRHCWVDGNEFEDNDAPVGGGVIVEGVFRKNTVLPGFSGSDYAGAGILRGEITDNRFDGCCEATEPYLRIEGPARVLGNIFTFISGDMCSGYEFMEMSGSMDLIGNLFADVGVNVCLRTNAVRELRPGHFRMEHNVFASWYSGLDLSYDANDWCPSQDATGPYTAIGQDSTRFACNIGNPEMVSIWRNGRRVPCGTCMYLFEDLPDACPDTIPDFRYGCEPFPVLVESSGLEAVPGGIRLYWTIPLDVSVLGFDVDREVGGRTERLTGERLVVCRPCEYIDTAPVEGQTATYTLRIYEGGAEPTSVVLGTWDGAALSGWRLSLEEPRPHPVADRTVLRLAVPRGGRAIRLELIDMGGRIVSVVKEGVFAAGSHAIAWDARDDRGAKIASGVYLLRLSAAGQSVSRKVLVLH